VNELGIGILIGGEGSRMGGVAKGLLTLPNGTRLVDRLMDECQRVAPQANLYLLGNRPEYASHEIPRLLDDPPNIGPLGGLRALLQQNHERVLLVGGDLPYLGASLLQRILSHPLETAVAVASGTPARWEPMLSCYRVAVTIAAVEAAIAAHSHGLASLLGRLSAARLQLTPDELAELRDWDTPEDVEQDRRGVDSW
jgi:molybdenum cofactor guanylyltransferase